MLFGQQKTGRVPGVVLAASANGGLSVTVDGAPARLVVMTDDGALVDAEPLAREAFAVSVNAYRDFLRGEGHLRTLSGPLPAK